MKLVCTCVGAPHTVLLYIYPLQLNHYMTHFDVLLNGSELSYLKVKHNAITWL